MSRRSLVDILKITEKNADYASRYATKLGLRITSSCQAMIRQMTLIPENNM